MLSRFFERYGEDIYEYRDIPSHHSGMKRISKTLEIEWRADLYPDGEIYLTKLIFVFDGCPIDMLKIVSQEYAYELWDKYIVLL